MGVLNATPDSFYAGSRTPALTQAISLAETMIQQGADLLDVGGESTRPGAAPVSLADESERLLPIIEALHTRWPAMPISVDTQKAAVAREALARGATIVNDISALRHDPEMAGVVARSRCGVVLMHMQGTPETMQRQPHYDKLIDEVNAFFQERLAFAARAGIAEEKIILDPGLGFGKTQHHNLELLRRLDQFTALGRPLLIGASRKSFIGAISAGRANPPLPAEERLAGSLAVAICAVQRGARGLRTHDVAATRQAINAWRSLQAPSL
jgi:dihydropteroate synthase